MRRRRGKGSEGKQGGEKRGEQRWGNHRGSVGFLSDESNLVGGVESGEIGGEVNFELRPSLPPYSVVSVTTGG